MTDESEPADSGAPSRENPGRRASGGDEPADGNGESNRQEPTGKSYGGPRRGLSGRLISAEAHAPEGATEGEIQDVAYVSWRTGRPIDDVWEEIDREC